MSSVADALAGEMQAIAYAAAEPVRPGDTIGRQISRAWEALSRPPLWRVRAAWYGEAGCWSGRAIEDFRERAERRQRKEDAARAKAARLGDLYAGIASRLETVDPDFHGDEIARLRRVAGRLGADDRAVAPGDGSAR